MSTAVVSTSAATGRLFVFDEEADPISPLPSVSHDCCAALHRTAPSTSLRTAEGGCPHMSFQSTIKNQPSAIDSIGSRKPAIGNFVIPASRLAIRLAPEMVSSGIPALDALTGGLPRGCLTEICGPASSGRTSLLLAALAAATRRGEFCVVVDASDALDPQSVAAAGVELGRLLWVRCGENTPQRHPSASFRTCPGLAEGAGSGTEKRIKPRSINQTEHRLEQVLRATDLLLESGGFGLIVLDLGDLPPQAARRIPLTTWFRFRRAIEHTPTILLAIEQQPIVGSCSTLLLQLGAASELTVDSSAAKRQKNAAHGASCGSGAEDENAPEERKGICIEEQFVRAPQFTGSAHTHLLTGLNITAELIRSRLERKPVRSTAAFASKAAWAG
jgi:hypothetical protein